MKFLGNIVLAFAANALALLAAASYIPGVKFAWHNDFLGLIRTAALITAINIFLKPLAKLFLGPFILLSLGVVAILLNAVLLWVATYWAPELSFVNIKSVLLASLLFGAINFVVAFIGRKA